MSLDRRWMPSPNRSSRGGARVTTIVLHTAEGATTIESLGNYFASPAAQVSSHVGIDDTANTVGEYVHRDGKAWTAANANPWSVQAELCAFAAWTAGDWDAHPTMLANTAAWIAEEAAVFGIPLELLDAAGAQNPAVAGVCQHADLGSMGGGHWDCGPGFPIGRVLDLARGGAQPEPEPEEDMPKATYTRERSSGEVYLAGIGFPSPRHVTSFADAEYHMGREGVTLIPPPDDANELITDAAGASRFVMVVDDGTLFGL